MKKCFTALAITVLGLGSVRAETPQYDKHVQPFLKTYCVECHNGRKAKARVNLESYEAMMKATRKGQKIITPGEPEKSRLMHTLEGKAKQMPPRKYAHQPRREEVALLRQWIAAGAKMDKEADAKPVPQASRQNRLDDLAVYVGQPPIAAVVTEGQLGVIDSQQVQNRRVQVVAVRRLDRAP